MILTLSSLTGIDGSVHGSDYQPPIIPTENHDAHAEDNKDNDGEPITGLTVLDHVPLGEDSP